MPAVKPTALKMLDGTGARNPAHLRNDEELKPAVQEAPLVEGFLQLSDEEREVFNWMVENGVCYGLQLKFESILFARAAKVYVQMRSAEEKVKEFGSVMRDPKSGMPKVQPYARLASQLSNELMGILRELGMTPAARLRLSSPVGPKTKLIESNWDEIT